MNFHFSKRGSHSKTVAVYGALAAILALTSWRFSMAAPPSPPVVGTPATQIAAFAQIGQSQFPKQEVDFLGFVTSDIVMLTRWKPNSNDTGHLVRWNIKSKRMLEQIPLSPWLSSSLFLTKDGRTLATTNVRTSMMFSEVKAFRITLLPSSNLKKVRTLPVPQNKDVIGFLGLSNDTQHTIVKTLISTQSGNDVIYANDRLEWLNVNTGKVDKVLPYSPARELDRLLSSPDKKYLAGLFYSEAFDPDGQSDYTPLRNTLEREGYVDIINPATGKILWHIESSDKRPVGDPFFFISPTQFVSSDTLFDIPTKTAKPWYAVTPKRKCLAAVPNHASYAMFVTPQGLELRDWRRKRTLRRWPTITKSGHILFSPDLKMFSFKRDSTIQFWKFDPAWLK